MTDAATVLTDPLEEVAPPKRRSGASAWVVWLVRRLGLAVLTLWLVSILTFLATAALGDPIRAILGRDYNSNPGRVKQLEELLNADQSLELAFLVAERMKTERLNRAEPAVATGAA